MFSRLLRKRSAASSPVESYVTTGLSQVEGWLLKDAVDLLLLLNSAQNSLQVSGDLGEIGVWQGKLLILFCLLANTSERVFGIDSFIHCTPPQLCEERLAQNLAAHAPGFDRLTLIKTDSKLLTADDLRRTTGGCRLFDVDGDHSSEGAYNDLVLASQVINPGGIILVDDYFNDTCPGVSEGTCRFFFDHPETQLAPFAICGNKIFITTGDYYGAYRDFIARQIESSDATLFQKARNFHQLSASLGVTLKLFGHEAYVLNSNL